MYRFCCNHGKIECKNQQPIPEELIWVAKILIPKLIYCLYEKTKNKEEMMEEGIKYKTILTLPFKEGICKCHERISLCAIICNTALSIL